MRSKKVSESKREEKRMEKGVQTKKVKMFHGIQTRILALTVFLVMAAVTLCMILGIYT